MQPSSSGKTYGSTAGGEPRARLSKIVPVGLPLALAIVLTGTFLYLLVQQAGKSRDSAAPSLEQALGKLKDGDASERPPVPYGSPTNRRPFERPKELDTRYGGKFPRWDLKDFPEGWNDAVAQALHSYFEELQYDPDKPVDFARIEKAREELKDYLAQLGPEALATLAGVLQVEWDFVNRRMIFETIGDLGPRCPEATFILGDFFVSRFENPENRSEMLHVVDAMGHLRNDTSYSTLLDFIDRGNQNPAYHNYRDKFIEALGEHPRREEAVPTFVESLHNDALTGARNKAAQALGKVRDPETLSELYNAVERERYWVVKQTILGTIGKIGDPSAVPFLESQAHTASENGVRLSAANAIRRIDSPEAENALARLAREESNPELKKRYQDWVKEKAR